jgi:hypothetical protein
VDAFTSRRAPRERVREGAKSVADTAQINCGIVAEVADSYFIQL